MDAETQENIKKIVENVEDDSDNEIIVILGAGDIEGALISAETVTTGDPSFTGPLAGVPLGLPVYHILEPIIEEAIPEDVYQENIGIVAMLSDRESIGLEFKKIRDRLKN
jgi:hypothetical protein